MKRHFAQGPLFLVSVALGWLVYTAGGSDWLFVYAGAGGPILMAVAEALDDRFRRENDS